MKKERDEKKEREARLLKRQQLKNIVDSRWSLAENLGDIWVTRMTR